MDEISAISGVASGKKLTPEQVAEVAKLAARDRDARAHEAAHLAAVGGLATGIEYTYELGPDGRLYAIGGKVKVSIPPGLSAEQQLAAARVIQAAADAPSDPSGQDMTVAFQASEMEATARQEIAKDHAKATQPKPVAIPHPQTHLHGLDRTA
jgi:hypothetical protein